MIKEKIKKIAENLDGFDIDSLNWLILLKDVKNKMLKLSTDLSKISNSLFIDYELDYGSVNEDWSDCANELIKIFNGKYNSEEDLDLLIKTIEKYIK